MAAQYLLKCPACHHPHPITVGQAGETFNCSQCHEKVEVPSMSGIRALPPVKESAGASRGTREWSHQQGVLFTGGLLALIIFGAVAGLSVRQALRLNISVPEDEVKRAEAREKVDTMDAAELWYIWAQGYGSRPLGEWQESQLAGARRWRKNFFAFAIISGVLAAGGIGAMIYSMQTQGDGQHVKQPKKQLPKSGARRH